MSGKSDSHSVFRDAAAIVSIGCARVATPGHASTANVLCCKALRCDPRSHVWSAVSAAPVVGPAAGPVAARAAALAAAPQPTAVPNPLDS